MNGVLKNLVKNLKGLSINHLMKKKLLIAGILLFIGIAARLWLYNFLPSAPHIYITLAGAKQPIFMMDVFFVIAAISLVAGRYLGSYFSFLLPLSIMAVTDIIIGNSMIFLFTWSGFAIMGSIGYASKRKSMLQFFGFSILAVVAYDLWTNFGCWLGWYSHDLNGLMLCYTLAIPFMLWHLVSTLAILPLFAIPFEKLDLNKMVEMHRIPTFSPTALMMALSILMLI